MIGHLNLDRWVLHLALALLVMAVPPLAIEFAMEEWGRFGLSGATVLLIRTSITGGWLCFCGLMGLYGPDVLSVVDVNFLLLSRH